MYQYLIKERVTLKGCILPAGAPATPWVCMASAPTSALCSLQRTPRVHYYTPLGTGLTTNSSADSAPVFRQLRLLLALQGKHKQTHSASATPDTKTVLRADPESPNSPDTFSTEEAIKRHDGKRSCMESETPGLQSQGPTYPAGLPPQLYLGGLGFLLGKPKWDTNIYRISLLDGLEKTTEVPSTKPGTQERLGCIFAPYPL